MFGHHGEDGIDTFFGGISGVSVRSGWKGAIIAVLKAGASTIRASGSVHNRFMGALNIVLSFGSGGIALAQRCVRV